MHFLSHRFWCDGLASCSINLTIQTSTLYQCYDSLRSCQVVKHLHKAGVASPTSVKDVLFSLLLVIAILRGETGYVRAFSLFSVFFLTIMQAVSMTSLLQINDPADDPQLPLRNKVDTEPTGRFLNVAFFDPGVRYIYSLGRIDLEAGPTRLHTLKSFHGSQIRGLFTMATFMLVPAVAHGEKRGPGAVNEALSRWLVFKSTPE